MAASKFEVTIELAANDKGSKIITLGLDKVAYKAATVAAKFGAISRGAFDMSKRAAVVGGLLAAPLIYGAKQAVGFEDAMAGVAKVTNTIVGSKAFNILGNEAKVAAVAIGIGADSSAELMASLASGGVVRADLADMTVTAGKVGVAFDLAAKDAGDSFVKMRNALGITNKEAKLAADSFNFISDNDASTAAQILTYMANGGASVARSLKVGAPQIATFGSALISMGKSGEEAATIMLRFQKALYLKDNKDMLATYKAAGSGAAGLMAVLKKGGDIKNADKQMAYFMRMGEYGSSVKQLALSYGVLQKNMALVKNQSAYEGSVDKEFANKNSTTGGQLRRLKAEASVLAIDLGTTLLPIIRNLTKELSPLLRQFGNWVKANPGLTAQIVKGVAAASAFSFAVSGVSGAVGGVFKVLEFGAGKWGTFGKAAKWVGEGISNKWFAGVFKVYERFPKFGTALFNLTTKFGSFASIGARIGPLLSGSFATIGTAIAGITWPIALAIAAVAAAGYVIYKNWDKIKPMLINTWRIIKNVAVGIYDTVVGSVGRAFDILATKFTWIRTSVNWIKEQFAKIKMPDWLKAAGNWVSGIGGSVSRGLANAANNTGAWANDAAARRGIDRQLTGAVGAQGGDAPRRRGFSAPVTFASNAARSAAANGGSALGALPGIQPVPRSGGGNVTVHAPITIHGTAGGEDTEKKVLAALKKHPKKVADATAEGMRLAGRTKF